MQAFLPNMIFCAGILIGCPHDVDMFTCGNGSLDPGEACDDGTTIPGDGCSSCKIEEGWHCSGSPSRCEPIVDAGVSDTRVPTDLPPDNIVDTGDDCAGLDGYCPKPSERAVQVNIDCGVVACPPGFPHVVGCDIGFKDSFGCVAHQKGDSKIYVQEGDDCCYGQTKVLLICSDTPGVLDAASCVIRGLLDPPGVFVSGGCRGCPSATCNGKEPHECSYP